MKIIITADWHFGYSGRLTDLINAFRSMISFCVKNEIKMIVMAGDLTHDREILSHDVSNAISMLLEEMNSNGIHMIAMVGNHDMFYRYKWKVSAIRPFAKQFTYIDDVSYFELDGRKFWAIPFIEHEQFYMRVVNDINKQATNDDILITHIGIASAKMNACFLVQNWSVVSFEDTKFSKVFAGHFHIHQKVGSKSWYPGSPLPFRFDEGLAEHGFIVYDTSSNKHVFIDLLKLMPDEVKPPDFITIGGKDIGSISNISKNDRLKIQLDIDDDQEEIKKQLQDIGITKVIFVKPKDDVIDVSNKQENFSRSNNIFKSWLDHDKPLHLDTKLLISLEEEIRSESRYNEDD